MVFQQLDTVIAFAGIMLLLSLMITTVVQAVISLLGLRGRNLFWGVEQLLHQLAPEQTQEMRQAARTVAGQILDHGVLADGRSWLRKKLGNGRWGPDEIKPKEIVLLLEQLDLGDNEQVKTAMKSLGVDGAVAQAKELKERVDTWFDTVMEAAADRFKLWDRWWTVIFAALLAFGLQVDSTDILRQLSSGQVRAQVLSQVEDLQGTQVAAPASADLDAWLEKYEQLDTRLNATGLTLFRTDWSLDLFGERFVGMLMTALLLSLGAPFWSRTLGKLIGFRSLVTQREKRTPSEAGGTAG